MEGGGVGVPGCGMPAHIQAYQSCLIPPASYPYQLYTTAGAATPAWKRGPPPTSRHTNPPTHIAPQVRPHLPGRPAQASLPGRPTPPQFCCLLPSQVIPLYVAEITALSADGGGGSGGGVKRGFSPERKERLRRSDSGHGNGKDGAGPGGADAAALLASLTPKVRRWPAWTSRVASIQARQPCHPCSSTRH